MWHKQISHEERLEMYLKSWVFSYVSTITILYWFSCWTKEGTAYSQGQPGRAENSQLLANPQMHK